MSRHDPTTLLLFLPWTPAAWAGAWTVPRHRKWGVRGIWNVWGDGFDSVFRSGGATVNLELGYNDVVAGRNTADAFEVFGKVGVSF